FETLNQSLLFDQLVNRYVGILQLYSQIICLFCHFDRRKKHAIHSSDTTSSDEERFERRKSKSMARARNRCLPLNFRAEDLASGILRERVKVGASLADVDPMIVDKSVRFDSIGGLSHHILALKEMVVFPLLYPEIFEKFKIQPPRGCLFYGPPGTGKTLVARALANECSQGDKKVAFFMRKGADCLSKWVGESERQLRLLFDQAYLMRPSIIFFDEIDGLAPVRSSRQDQIHSSIVSTLLALMDGLDNRGEIVVIGATNRLDSIDPALRRPGRFDREFLFNLPDQKARKHILQIHTRDWNPKLSDPFLGELAEKCVGYCGADIKALCTEAALIALRRRYPQIYVSSQKLQLDVSSVVLSAQDFYHAMQNIVPASQRAVTSSGHALSPVIRPLLERTFTKLLEVLHKVFPHAEFSQGDKSEGMCFGVFLRLQFLFGNISTGFPVLLALNLMSAYHQPTSYRPRLLLSGERGSGQTSHLAPALLHTLEKFSVHRLDLPALYSVSAKTPEESCAQIFREARRTVPSIVYMPHIGDWWEAVSETVRATFLTLLQDIPSFSPIFLLSTSESMYSELPEEVKCIFRIQYEEVFYIQRPSEEDRLRFFKGLILDEAAMPPPRRKQAALRALEVLPLALPCPARELSEAEKQRMEDQEENTLRELRLFLRDVTKRLATDKRFNIFSKPVDIEEVSDYLEVIKEPMDLSTVITKIDKHNYLTAKDFLTDIDLICSNALEYNPDKDPGDKIIRHRACTLKDTAHAIIAAELDPEFNKMCEEIKEARRKRGMFNLIYYSRSASRPVRHHPSLQKKDALPVGTKSIVEHGEQINVGIAVLTEDVVKSELYSKNPSKPNKQNQTKVNKQTVHFERLTVLTIVFQITGIFKSKKTRKVAMEQSKPTSLEQVPEEPSDPLPSVVVDHDRLKKLLDLVVKKSDNLTVDQLERLYSLLSQSIYRHRRDYDKSQLIEVML
uniref:ATPase family AAA domain-containing protein 2 n=1 Tax=Bubo bubo TaxID=30461 RepID=A0A8C0F5G6_BUBBB